MEHGKHEQRVERTPRRKRHQSTRRPGGRGIAFVLGTILLIGVVTGIMMAGLFMMYVKTTLAPNLDVEAQDFIMNQSSIIYYQDKASGEWKELQTLHTQEDRVLVTFDQIPDAMWQAAISIEDERFMTHHGVDWKRTIGAAGNMFLHAKNTYGGSTITQQLLKNLTGDDEGTIKRKVTEIFRALEFEKKYSKEEILELYLNRIYLGNGKYGVQTAAQYYFGKNVEDLTVAECACIIGITNNPSMYAPMRTDSQNHHILRDAQHVENNKNRQELILDKMEQLGYLTEEECQQAKQEKLQFAETTVEDSSQDDEEGSAGVQSYFVDQVRRDVVNDLAEQLGVSTKLAEQKILYGGYKIYTTLDPDIQAICEDVYENDYLHVTSAMGQPLRSAITIVDVTNGNVVAMVGDMGKKKGDMVWNYATDLRQCGSSIKPLSVYAPALDANVITMASTFDNYPVRLLNGKPWPKNSPSGYTGWTTLSTGVARSINTVAVQVVEKLGLNSSFQFMTENLGFTTLVSREENPANNDQQSGALGLGGLYKGVTTEEMAAGYAAFANDGIYNSPRLYTRVTDANDNVILENETETRVAMKETTAYFMNTLLQGVVNGGTGSSARFSGMAIGGKTGTTSDNYDRYFVGYTPYYSAAVWCGYKSNEKVVYSGNPSITMWKKVMSRIHANLESKSFSKPSSGLTTVSVCMDSGLLATDACAMDLRGSRIHQVEIAAGTAPTESCTMHVVRDYCTEGGGLAGEFCPESSVVQKSFLDYTRTDYGEGIVADDNGYLLGTLEARLEAEGCPAHTTAAEEPAEDPTPEEPGSGDGDHSGGSTGGESGGNTGGGDPQPTEPSGGSPEEPGGDTWWENLWGGTD